MADMEARHKEQMALQVEQQNAELTDRIEDAVQKAKLEGLYRSLMLFNYNFKFIYSYKKTHI